MLQRQCPRMSGAGKKEGGQEMGKAAGGFRCGWREGGVSSGLRCSAPSGLPCGPCSLHSLLGKTWAPQRRLLIQLSPLPHVEISSASPLLRGISGSRKRKQEVGSRLGPGGSGLIGPPGCVIQAAHCPSLSSSNINTRSYQEPRREGSFIHI